MVSDFSLCLQDSDVEEVREHTKASSKYVSKVSQHCFKEFTGTCIVLTSRCSGFFPRMLLEDCALQIMKKRQDSSETQEGAHTLLELEH